MEDLVVEEVVGGEAGEVEEEVVLYAGAGEDGHGDLDVAALIGGRDEVEGGQSEAQRGAGGGA